MVTEERLKRAITLRKDDVFLRSEFSRFGSPAQLSRALKQLIAEGVLVNHLRCWHLWRCRSSGSR